MPPWICNAASAALLSLAARSGLFAAVAPPIAAALPAFGAGDGETGTTKDLSAYMNAIAGTPTLPQSVRDKALSLKDLVVKSLVMQNQVGSAWSGKAFGCSITLKSDSSVYDRLDLNADTKWNEFCSYAGFPNAY